MAYFATKFASARDELLHIMCSSGWADMSEGDVESPAGYFYLISNSVPELAELVAAFQEDITSLGVSPDDVVGHFVVVEGSSGFVGVGSFDSEADAQREFDRLGEVYTVWEIGGDDVADLGEQVRPGVDCSHVWVAGMCYVDDEDVAAIAAIRPVSCEKCDSVYRP